ncbi:MAG TPA: L-histidine N(alpha)-methyltransferase [Egibacteraceae bacterium]|nr:L-histidine N(alpha)-methyltransferase [Egibacteraceae bacterium]
MGATLLRLTSPDAGALRAALAADVREGLTATPRRLPSKWLYDARGSALFDGITRTPEYYLTRTEAAILADRADEIVAAVEPAQIVEIGSGSARKTRLLLEALHRHRTGRVYVPFDVSAEAVAAASAALAADYPWLDVQAVVGDFHEHLHEVPRAGRRLVACLGSTIGNFPDDGQVALLTDLAGMLEDGDALLLGADLVKDRRVLEAAYDDAAGVTAAFTMNLVTVLQRELGADIDVGALRHVARWEPAPAWIEIALQAVHATVLRFPTLDFAVALEAGEMIRTEVSAKYTRATLADRLDAAGLALRAWHTDPAGWFALAVAARA